MAGSLPRSRRPETFAQTFIRPGRRVQTRQKLSVSLWMERNHGPVQNRVFSRVPGCLENKLRPVLAEQGRCVVDQPTHLRLDPDIQCVAPGLFRMSNTHESSIVCNDVVITWPASGSVAAPIESVAEPAARVLPGDELNGSTVNLLKTAIDFL